VGKGRSEMGEKVEFMYFSNYLLIKNTCFFKESFRRLGGGAAKSTISAGSGATRLIKLFKIKYDKTFFEWLKCLRSCISTYF